MSRTRPKSRTGRGVTLCVRTARPLLVLPALLAITGCQIGYVWQQGFGQLRLLSKRERLESDAARENLSAEQIAKLDLVPDILEFAKTELHLTPGDSYTSLLDTGGKPISTIVLASSPRSLSPYRWCFPFVGCVPYKGYFDEEAAQREADALRQDGWDVVVLPVGAYSTLGWFSDPVLSTMLDDSLPDLVELLIHETVHRTVYFSGQTNINESLATHIAREGTRLYFEAKPNVVSEEELTSYHDRIAHRAIDKRLLERLRFDLHALYGSDLEADAKTRRKLELFETAKKARRQIYGRSVDLPVSNAFVLANANYSSLLPTFAALQEKLGGHPRDLMAYLIAEREKNDVLSDEKLQGP